MSDNLISLDELEEKYNNFPSFDQFSYGTGLPSSFGVVDCAFNACVGYSKSDIKGFFKQKVITTHMEITIMMNSVVLCFFCRFEACLRFFFYKLEV